MNTLRAIIFDVDGTLANTERDGHRVAFNRAFVELGLNWRWDVEFYGELLKVTGGKERIKHYIGTCDIDVVCEDIDKYVAEIHELKTKHYLRLLQGEELSLRTGILELLRSARTHGIIIAIATTTSLKNVNTLLQNKLGPDAENWFRIIGAGDMMAQKKPAPDVYNFVLGKLGLEPKVCIAIEDSQNGLLSAQSAGIKTVVTVNNYT